MSEHIRFGHFPSPPNGIIDQDFYIDALGFRPRSLTIAGTFEDQVAVCRSYRGSARIYNGGIQQGGTRETVQAGTTTTAVSDGDLYNAVGDTITVLAFEATRVKIHITAVITTGLGFEWAIEG